jgi:hypothetical protein
LFSETSMISECRMQKNNCFFTFITAYKIVNPIPVFFKDFMINFTADLKIQHFFLLHLFKKFLTLCLARKSEYTKYGVYLQLNCASAIL